MTTLKQTTSVDGTVISNNDPSMVITLDPTSGVRISSIQDDSITYSFTENVEQDVVVVMYFDDTGEGGNADLTIPILYKSPPITVTGIPPQDVKLNDVVVFDPEITCGDWPLTEDWTTVELTAPNDYIAVEGKGFKVIKDEAESLNRSIEFKFSGKFDSGRGEPVDWFVIKTINITIAAQ